MLPPLSRHPIPEIGIQKTFSAGPCSLVSKELWFAAWVRRVHSNRRQNRSLTAKLCLRSVADQ
jgi:hypothetical protein